MQSFIQLNLHENISKAILQQGYTEPTPIQLKSIPHIIEGKDIVASAPTGTGKTAAFVLPALHRLLSHKGPAKKTRILILTPTRELAGQITAAAAQYGKFLRFNIVNLVGGMPYHQQIRELSRGADIIVATPGRLLDLINTKRVDLSDVEMLILDEADRMLDMGFIDDVEDIATLTPTDRQTLLFSATVDKNLMNMVRHLLKNPVRIDLSNEKVSIPLIEQQLYRANNPQHKTRLLAHFLNDKNIYKAIIFTGTKISADKLADKLNDDGFSAAALHGDLRQNVRNRTIEQLRRGKIQFLVATDVAARGIDISDITHVINYDLPRFCEDYVHRIGRTGRAGKRGIAISFVLPTDTRNLQRIERFIGQRLKLITNLDVGQGEQGGGEGGEGGRAFEKPAFKREFHRDNEFRTKRSSSSQHDRPFKKRSDSKSSAKRDDTRERDFSRYQNNDRPSKKRFDDKTPSYTEGRRDRGASSRYQNNDRPSKKRFDDKARFHTEGKRNRNAVTPHQDHDSVSKKYSDNKDRFRTGKYPDRNTASSKDGQRPFKKRSIEAPEGNRFRRTHIHDNDPTLRKRIVNKDRSIPERRTKSE